MPKIVDATAQRRRIRQAALHVFSRRGVTGTGLAHVATAARLSRASLYHYYTNKSALIEDVARHLLDEEERMFAEALAASGSVRERLQNLASAVIMRFSEWAACGRPLLEIWSRDAQALRPLMRQWRAALATLITEGQKTGEIDSGLEPQATAMLIISLIDGLMLQIMMDPEGAPPNAKMQDALSQALQRIIVPEENC